MNNQVEIKKVLIQTAAFYDTKLNETRLNIFAEVLSEYTVEEIKRSIKMFMTDPKIRFMPLPAEIIEKIRPVANDQSLAVEAAGRITTAIPKFGYLNPTDARDYIGELGWKVIERLGGWSHICQTLQVDDTKIFYAQCRDLAKAQIDLARAGKLDVPPDLPKLERSPLPDQKFLNKSEEQEGQNMKKLRSILPDKGI